MRKVTYGAACSLDGFIAPPDGAMDWLHFSKDVQSEMAAYWSTIDTVLMGRKTWEFAAAHAPGGGAMPGIAAYVFSRTLREVPGGSVVADDPAAFVNALKRKSGKGICVMGGSDLAQALLAGDAIDEVGMNVHPILLGAGVPLFRDAGRRVRLALQSSKVIDGGCVYSLYRVLH